MNTLIEQQLTQASEFILAAHVVDGYKLGHAEQYVKKTKRVYSNMTPRSDRLARAIKEHFDGRMIFFGAQKAIVELHNNWQKNFFDIPRDEVERIYTRRVKHYLGPDNGDFQIQCMLELHDLGYLPLEIKTLDEGTAVDMQIPTITIKNTDDRFWWLTNYTETYLSCSVWHLCNAASISREYYKTSKRWGSITGAPQEWLAIANHCFAARGHRGDQDARDSGMGHLLFSIGTDTLWAIDAMEMFYQADVEKEIVGVSVNAFEHATATQRIAYFRQVMGMNEHPLQAETESIKDIVTNLYPNGIVSYVADSEDYFGVIGTIAKELKDLILARGEDALGLSKFVFRPDSSPKTPFEIIVGDGVYHTDIAPTPLTKKLMEQDGCEVVKYDGKHYTTQPKKGVSSLMGVWEWVEVEPTPEQKGSLQILWEIFGGTVNEKGYKVINPKVGLIYGEAIDIELQEKIYKEMAKQGWCVSNVLFGVGSWGFLDRSSRDSFSQALKGTHSIVDDLDVSMQKNPKTAAKSKKSLRGYIRVERDPETGKLVAFDEQTEEQEQQGLLLVRYRNGCFYNLTCLEKVRVLAQSYD
ncbi:putative nicotinamide phosphoribosyl transferase [Pseudoalteromonas phage J2-1_QLiu-2017]|nr:putative nicotinamide phosphoribosyl transferase [Pseudoalteromonas phage J2-1_QLiu-2017]